MTIEDVDPVARFTGRVRPPARPNQDDHRIALTPLRWRNGHAVGLAGVLTVFLIALFFDARAARWAASLPADFVLGGRLISDVGLSGYMFATSALLCLGTGLWAWRSRQARPRALAWRAAFFFVCILDSGAAVQTVKHIVGRERPAGFARDGAFAFHPLSWPNLYASFPSGHTTTIFAAAVALALMLPRLTLPLITLAAAVGCSRVIVSDHFPSDVIGGAVLGAACALATAHAFARHNRVFQLTAKAQRSSSAADAVDSHHPSPLSQHESA
jgi:membrane-associated phospholipid phosphatase